MQELALLEDDQGKVDLNKDHKSLQVRGNREFHLGRGHDSDVFRVGEKVLKVYCNVGYFCGRQSEVSFASLERYRTLTEEAKQLLEEHPPSAFRQFQGDRLFNVSYVVIPLERIYPGIGPNIQGVARALNDYYPMGGFYRHVDDDLEIVASTQQFVPGQILKDSNGELIENTVIELERKGIPVKVLDDFLTELWDNFPNYNLIHFGNCLTNVKVAVDEDLLIIKILDLASKIRQQVNYFERGKKYAEKEIKRLLQERSTVLY